MLLILGEHLRPGHKIRALRPPGFLTDLRRLPDEHRKLFVESVLRPALDAGAHKGTVPWPRALRIHRIGVAYSMTWSFSGPDGRALFRLAEVAGETVVVWLRIGNHGMPVVVGEALGLLSSEGPPDAAPLAQHTGHRLSRGKDQVVHLPWPARQYE